MKILLVCAGGMSTSILMKKIEYMAQFVGEEFDGDGAGRLAVDGDVQRYARVGAGRGGRGTDGQDGGGEQVGGQVHGCSSRVIAAAIG